MCPECNYSTLVTIDKVDSGFCCLTSGCVCSGSILELQKDRYFEGLTAKYWNASLRGECPSRGDSEGITLHSLGKK